MFSSHRIVAGAIAILALSLLATTPATAQQRTSITVHFYSPTGTDGGLTAHTLDGSQPVATDDDHDDFGATTEFVFDGDQDQIAVTAAADSKFAADTRVIPITDGETDVWMIDGDARAYSAPQLLDQTERTPRQAFIAVEDLAGHLDLSYEYGMNGYEFDGADVGTTRILTIHDDRDYYEIAVDSNRIGTNVTGNMLDSFTDLVFEDIDGYRDGGQYFLSFGAVESLFQVRTLIHDDDALLLEPVSVAHDELSDADPASVGLDPDRLDELDDYIQQQVDDGGPAVAVAVTKDGKLVKDDAYGFAQRYSTSTDADGGHEPAQLLPESDWEPASTQTLFDLASNTKMYATNYAIQRLVSEGRLDLDQRICTFDGWEKFTDDNSDYTGDWTIGGEGGIEEKHLGKQTVTVRDLLHHEGGLIPDPQYPNLDSAGGLWSQTTDPDDRTEIIDAISRTPLMYEPRSQFAYSDVDYMILGLLVEQITGQRLDDYLHDEFYEPLGLDRTGFRPLDAGIEQDEIAATELNGNTRDGAVSFGELENGDPVPIRDYTLQGEVHDEKAFYSMAGVAGHAGLFSTAGDMAVLTQLMLNDGFYGGTQYFDPDVAQEFTTPYSIDPDAVDSSTIGLGWRLHSKSSAEYYYFNWGPSRSSYGHQGWTGTLTVIDPVHHMTITILTNMRHSPVDDPPNGFEGAEFDVSSLVPISAHIYRALSGQDVQFTPAAEVADVEDVTVDQGTSAAGAAARLAQVTTLTDRDDREWPVQLNWELPDFDGQTPGVYTATGYFDLPDGVTAGEPPMSQEVTASVTVTEAPQSPTTSPSTPPEHSEDPDSSTTPSPSESSTPGSRDLPPTGAALGSVTLAAGSILAAGVAVLRIRRRLG